MKTIAKETIILLQSELEEFKLKCDDIRHFSDQEFQKDVNELRSHNQLTEMIEFAVHRRDDTILCKLKHEIKILVNHYIHLIHIGVSVNEVFPVPSDYMSTFSDSLSVLFDELRDMRPQPNVNDINWGELYPKSREMVTITQPVFILDKTQTKIEDLLRFIEAESSNSVSLKKTESWIVVLERVCRYIIYMLHISTPKNNPLSMEKGVESPNE